MSTMMMPLAGGELPAAQLPVVDEVLAMALTAQGAAGARALGLLRDARRILAGTGLERPAEVAESCLRDAADTLLSAGRGGPEVRGQEPASLRSTPSPPTPASRWWAVPLGPRGPRRAGQPAAPWQRGDRSAALAGSRRSGRGSRPGRDALPGPGLGHGPATGPRGYQFKMVHESVREREVLMRIAPHLADLQPFLYLLYHGYPEGKALLNLGLTFYDAFSRAPLRRWHHMLGRAAVLRREPHLNPAGLKGAGLYHDAKTDDARLVTDVLKSASQAGALLANHAEATGLVHERGRIAGAEVHDRITGDQSVVRARTVVNAAGPWVDQILGLQAPVPHPTLRPTKGTHIVLRTDDFPLRTAVFLRSPSDDRVVWPTPTPDGRHVYIGSTDTTFDGSPDDVVADEQDINYLLEVANHTLPDAKVGPEHVVGTWAGLRPIMAPPPGTSNSDASREHTITETDNGLITVAGGKLTTARIMGRQIIDHVVRRLATDHAVRAVPDSTTDRTPISGGDRADRFRAERALAPLTDELRDRWLRRYGGNADHVAAAGAHNLVPGTSLTDAEIRYAVEDEMAMTVSDVLVRRTGSFFWSPDGDAAAVEHVSDVLAERYHYTPTTRTAQQKDYRTWVARNRGQRAPGMEQPTAF